MVTLTYEQRIRWFIDNYYETGMEYQILLDTMKNENLDRFEWYGDIINIPRQVEEEHLKYFIPND